VVGVTAGSREVLGKKPVTIIIIIIIISILIDVAISGDRSLIKKETEKIFKI
jgi:hypothetical protein